MWSAFGILLSNWKSLFYYLKNLIDPLKFIHRPVHLGCLCWIWIDLSRSKSNWKSLICKILILPNVDYRQVKYNHFFELTQKIKICRGAIPSIFYNYIYLYTTFVNTLAKIYYSNSIQYLKRWIHASLLQLLIFVKQVFTISGKDTDAFTTFYMNEYLIYLCKYQFTNAHNCTMIGIDIVIKRDWLH